MNSEHIIPLSLGGCNDFTIMVSEEKNSEVNKKVDANMNNDFLMKFCQIQHGYKGHSGSEPTLKVKNAKVNDTPVGFQLTKSEIKVRDHINKVDLQGEQKVKLNVAFDLNIRGKFISKVALATGYFIFGDVFTNNSDHESLRNYIFLDNIENVKSSLRFYDQFQFPDNGSNKTIWEINKLIAERKQASGVIWGYGLNMIVVHAASSSLC